jgi:hypothetical protein
MGSIRQFVQRHPRRAHRHSWITGKEVLMEVRDSETDHSNVDALSTFSA